MGCLSGACGVRLLASEDELPLVRPDVAEGHAKHATCSYRASHPKGSAEQQPRCSRVSELSERSDDASYACAEQQSCDSQVLTGTGSEYFTIEDGLDEKGQEDDVSPY